MEMNLRQGRALAALSYDEKTSLQTIYPGNSYLFVVAFLVVSFFWFLEDNSAPLRLPGMRLGGNKSYRPPGPV